MRVIYACDIGTTRPARKGRQKRILGVAFAWAKISPREPSVIRVSQDIERLVTELGNDMRAGKSVALGFEAPLFIPVPNSAENLSRRRDGEKDRSFAAPVGLAVAALAVHQVAWILAALRHTFKEECIFTSDWKIWPPRCEQQTLFCWEAFVSRNAHSSTHVYDAATAATCFFLNENNLDQANAVTAERPLSLIGSAALWSGWTNDVAALHSPSLVIMPTEPYKGPLEPV